ncbi:hypothetical protein ACJJTC_009650 [Scirpophaga incertulas]
MATKTTDWRPGPTVCRCCLSEGCYKDISTEYFWMGKREVYAEMLLDTYNLKIAYSKSGGPNSNSRLICEPCISRLRDATDFKRQVEECEKTFMQYLDPATTSNAVLDVTSASQIDFEVKVEQVKMEKPLSDTEDFDDRPDFGDDDDDDDDLDDQPLMNLATKGPKKESIQLMDLLDNAKAGDKRKSTTKPKSSPAKKTKSVIKLKKDTAKPSSSKSSKTEKKKKDLRLTAETSVWQLTVSERKNASALIYNTTVRPFVFMGSTFKCFYCMEYFSEVKLLLEHTNSHKTDNEDVIFNKYIVKGKRTLQVDISELKCRACNEAHPNLDTIKQHLEITHKKQFYAGGNGMTEFSLRLKNDLLSCHICQKDFPTFRFLNSHMNNHINKVICENCGAGFISQHLLMIHRESHYYKKFQCKHCDDIFYKKGQLRYHTEIKHRGKERTKPKKCPHCTLCFKEYHSKIAHLREVHGISRTFICHFCKATFITRRALTEHTNRYHTEKYRCDVCSKCFTIESRLKQHMRGHTGERNFACPVCKNRYMHEMTLRKHIKTHNTEFKFVCVKCAAGFNSRNEYHNHVKQTHIKSV